MARLRYSVAYHGWLAIMVLCSSLFGWALNPWAVAAAGSKGEAAATLAISLMGSPYVYGAAGPSSFDCSGLVQYVGRQVGVTLPRTAADQALVPNHLPDNLWSGDLPVGALIFLADVSVGPGVTHVSMYLGGGMAADCYNEQSGCIIHDVRASDYYRGHWVYATYPWGDTPAYGSGPGTPTNTSPTGPAGLGAITTVLTNPGPLALAAATPIAAVSSVGQKLGQGSYSFANNDPQELAASQMSGVPELVGWAKWIDTLFPLHIVALFAAALTVWIARVIISVLRYVKGLAEV